MYWAYLDWWDYERRQRLLDEQEMITAAAYQSYAQHRPKSIQDAQRSLDARMRRPPPWVGAPGGGLTEDQRATVAEILRRVATQEARIVTEPGLVS